MDSRVLDIIRQYGKPAATQVSGNRVVIQTAHWGDAKNGVRRVTEKLREAGIQARATISANRQNPYYTITVGASMRTLTIGQKAQNGYTIHAFQDTPRGPLVELRAAGHVPLLVTPGEVKAVKLTVDQFSTEQYVEKRISGLLQQMGSPTLADDIRKVAKLIYGPARRKLEEAAATAERGGKVVAARLIQQALAIFENEIKSGKARVNRKAVAKAVKAESPHSREQNYKEVMKAARQAEMLAGYISTLEGKELISALSKFRNMVKNTAGIALFYMGGLGKHKWSAIDTQLQQIIRALRDGKPSPRDPQEAMRSMARSLSEFAEWYKGQFRNWRSIATLNSGSLGSAVEPDFLPALNKNKPYRPRALVQVRSLNLVGRVERVWKTKSGDFVYKLVLEGASGEDKGQAIASHSDLLPRRAKALKAWNAAEIKQMLRLRNFDVRSVTGSDARWKVTLNASSPSDANEQVGRAWALLGKLVPGARLLGGRDGKFRDGSTGAVLEFAVSGAGRSAKDRFYRDNTQLDSVMRTLREIAAQFSNNRLMAPMTPERAQRLIAQARQIMRPQSPQAKLVEQAALLVKAGKYEAAGRFLRKAAVWRPDWESNLPQALPAPNHYTGQRSTESLLYQKAQRIGKALADDSSPERAVLSLNAALGLAQREGRLTVRALDSAPLASHAVKSILPLWTRGDKLGAQAHAVVALKALGDAAEPAIKPGLMKVAGEIKLLHDEISEGKQVEPGRFDELAKACEDTDMKAAPVAGQRAVAQAVRLIQHAKSLCGGKSITRGTEDHTKACNALAQAAFMCALAHGRMSVRSSAKYAGIELDMALKMSDGKYTLSEPHS